MMVSLFLEQTLCLSFLKKLGARSKFFLSLSFLKNNQLNTINIPRRLRWSAKLCFPSDQIPDKISHPIFSQKVANLS